MSCWVMYAYLITRMSENVGIIRTRFCFDNASSTLLTSRLLSDLKFEISHTVLGVPSRRSERIESTRSVVLGHSVILIAPSLQLDMGMFPSYVSDYYSRITRTSGPGAGTAHGIPCFPLAPLRAGNPDTHCRVSQRHRST